MNMPNLSPVSLSYVAALRSVKPRMPGKAFSYALVDCRDAEGLIGLAASNPEGQFYGFTRDNAACANAQELAKARHVNNVRMICAAPREILAHANKDELFLPKLDYLICDESDQPLSALDRNAVFDLAATCLGVDGLFVTGYKSNPNVESTLRFLVREFAPEMNVNQANVFLTELKKLGKLYFAERKDQAQALDQAIQRHIPDEFFALFDGGEARSAAFDTIVALHPRGLAYAGDTHIPANYVELAVPQDAQSIIVGCRENPLYEAIKDFTLNRTVRHDIWRRQGASLSANPVDLFGGFSYGITCASKDVPSQFAAEGKTIPLDSPLYKALIELMTLMPVSIGDILIYPECKGFAVSDILEAVQVLVACGVARPMRGLSITEPEAIGSIAQPRLAGSYNQYLGKTTVQGETFSMASAVLGDTIMVSSRDALVMQALDRAGLANSVSALMPELERLSDLPEAAQQVMNAAKATPEIAQQMVEDVVSQSIVKWYAYGLLQAA